MLKKLQASKAAVKPAKSKLRARSASLPPSTRFTETVTRTLTLPEYLHRIDALGKRIRDYVEFMCRLGTQSGTSDEIRERAVIEFHRQMIVVESQLGKIHDALRLE